MPKTNFLQTSVDPLNGSRSTNSTIQTLPQTLSLSVNSVLQRVKDNFTFNHLIQRLFPATSYTCDTEIYHKHRIQMFWNLNQNNN